MHRLRPENGSRVTLPITPMLDMTFQLLFFFITSFNPADQEGQVDMALPSNETRAGRLNPPNGGEAPEFPSDFTVKVRTRIDGVNDGDISDLSVRNIEGKEEPIRNGSLTELRDYLAKKREEMTNKDNIKVQGDSKLKVKSLMKVMDVCRQVGFKNVSMVPPEGFGR
jgi:biopolymer transport protein ExbD